jgi:hypothetical protein
MKVHDTQRHFLKSDRINEFGDCSLQFCNRLVYEDFSRKRVQLFSSRIVRLNYMIDSLILVNAFIWPSLLLLEFMFFYSC